MKRPAHHAAADPAGARKLLLPPTPSGGPAGADLHIHTRYSDGTYTPEQLVAAAVGHRLGALAVTDHDTVEGCTPTAAACAAAGLGFVPGVELTAEEGNRELHILGYGFDPAHPRLLERMTLFQNVRQQRIHEMVARLNRLHVPLQVDAVFALANCRAPGRPHVARALVAAGLCGSLDEAFERFLKKHRPAWVPKFKISVAEALALLHTAGGLAVLAHPGLSRVDDLIPALVEAGLDGLECFHVKHNAAQTRHYLQLAARLDLLVSGGSDCHGLSKGQPLLGTVLLPWEHFQQFQARLHQATPASGPGCSG